MKKRAHIGNEGPVKCSVIPAGSLVTIKLRDTVEKGGPRNTSRGILPSFKDMVKFRLAPAELAKR